MARGDNLNLAVAAVAGIEYRVSLGARNAEEGVDPIGQQAVYHNVGYAFHRYSLYISPRRLSLKLWPLKMPEPLSRRWIELRRQSSCARRAT